MAPTYFCHRSKNGRMGDFLTFYQNILSKSLPRLYDGNIITINEEKSKQMHFLYIYYLNFQYQL